MGNIVLNQIGEPLFHLDDEGEESTEWPFDNDVESAIYFLWPLRDLDVPLDVFVKIEKALAVLVYSPQRSEEAREKMAAEGTPVRSEPWRPKGWT